MADRWAALLADTLNDVGRRLARLTEAVREDWSDQHGQQWCERAGRLQRELAERAATADELGERLGPTDPGSRSTRPGVRLGGTGGQRVDDERGMRVAELPD